MTTRNDGWINLLKGTGTRLDATRAGRFTLTPSRPREELEAMYAVGGLASRIIDMPIDEMLRPGWEIEGPDSDKIHNRMSELGIKSKLSEGMKLGQLYGGAATVVVSEGVDLYSPLPNRSRGRVIALRSYDRWQISLDNSSIEQNAGSPLYGQPTRYIIAPYSTGIPYHVHRDHVILWPGRTVPPRVKMYNNGWDYSALDPLFDALEDLDNSMHASSAILQSFNMDTLSVNGLSDMLAAGKESEVQKRIEILDLSRHVINMTLLDADGEQYNRISSSVAGIGDIIDRQQMYLSALAAIPVTKLFRRSPGGMNATGESDVRNWYDDLDADRHQILAPALERLTRRLYLEIGNEPEFWSVKFNPLWQMSDKESADVRKTVAETDKTYHDIGVYTAADIMFARMREDGFRKEVTPITEKQLDDWIAEHDE